jgi:hypothetical protein
MCLVIGTPVHVATLPVRTTSYPLPPPSLSRCQITSNVPSIMSLWYRMVAWKIMKLSTGQLYFYFCASRLQKSNWSVIKNKYKNLVLTSTDTDIGYFWLNIFKITGSDIVVESSWNVMAHSDAQERKWRGNWRMEWVASTLHTISEHGVSSISTPDAHTSAASSQLNWRPRRFKWTRPFRRKTKSGFCTCAITFQTQSNKLCP